MGDGLEAKHLGENSKPEVLTKPFQQTLTENTDGQTFVRTFLACKGSIQQGEDKGIKMFVTALIHVLKSTTVNREALLQWLESNSKYQLEIMLYGPRNPVETQKLSSCEMLKEVFKKWNIRAKYPDQQKILYDQIKALFAERHARALKLELDNKDLERQNLEKENARIREEAESLSLQLALSCEEALTPKSENDDVEESKRKRPRHSTSGGISSSTTTARGSTSSSTTTTRGSTSSSTKTTIPLVQVQSDAHELPDDLLQVDEMDIDRMIMNVLSITTAHTSNPQNPHELVSLICKTMFRVLEMRKSINKYNARTAQGTWNTAGSCAACMDKLIFPNFRSTCMTCINGGSTYEKMVDLWYPYNRVYSYSSSSASGEKTETNTERAEPVATDPPQQPQGTLPKPDERVELQVKKEMQTNSSKTGEGNEPNPDYTRNLSFCFIRLSSKMS